MTKETDNIWAVVKDGVIANLIVWDGETPYEADGDLIKQSALPKVTETIKDEDGNDQVVERTPSIGEALNP